MAEDTVTRATPGPWTARARRAGDEWWVEAPKADGTIGYLSECVARGEQNEANARLISCAPELLAEVKRLAHGFRACILHAGSDPEFADAAIAPALALIAKAEGPAPATPRDSAQPCGCDPGANWTCEAHRSAAQS